MIISKERYLRAERYHAKFELNFEPEKLWPNGTVDLNVLTIVRENELYHEAKERESVVTNPDSVVTKVTKPVTGPGMVVTQVTNVDNVNSNKERHEAKKAYMREWQAKRRAR